MSEFVKSIQLQYEIPNKNRNKKPRILNISRDLY
ncbi:hypothetical protein AMTRI_Chr10g1470 [Amborella trichopoda]